MQLMSKQLLSAQNKAIPKFLLKILWGERGVLLT